MTDVLRAPTTLWSSGSQADGVLARWLVAPGRQVPAGAPVAELRIDGTYHVIKASAGGRVDIRAGENSIIRPGAILAFIAPQAWRRLATCADASAIQKAVGY